MAVVIQGLSPRRCRGQACAHGGLRPRQTLAAVTRPGHAHGGPWRRLNSIHSPPLRSNVTRLRRSSTVTQLVTGTNRQACASLILLPFSSSSPSCYGGIHWSCAGSAAPVYCNMCLLSVRWYSAKKRPRSNAVCILEVRDVEFGLLLACS